MKTIKNSSNQFSRTWAQAHEAIADAEVGEFYEYARHLGIEEIARCAAGAVMVCGDAPAPEEGDYVLVYECHESTSFEHLRTDCDRRRIYWPASALAECA